MEFRAGEVRKLESDASLTVSDVTTINLTKVNGGVQTNVVPTSLVLTFDIRVALDVDLQEFEKQVCATSSFNRELDSISVFADGRMVSRSRWRHRNRQEGQGAHQVDQT